MIFKAYLLWVMLAFTTQQPQINTESVVRGGQTANIICYMDIERGVGGSQGDRKLFKREGEGSETGQLGEQSQQRKHEESEMGAKDRKGADVE